MSRDVRELMNHARFIQTTPWIVGAAAAAAVVLWLFPRSGPQLPIRVPGTDHRPGSGSGAPGGNPVLRGTVIASDGRPSDLPGDWPRFRGPDGDGISPATTRLAREWGSAGPKKLWSIPVGEGYAGAVVHAGCVYLMDYDREKQNDALRCLSLADGREIWRFAYPNKVKRNHGMSRTVPAVTDQQIVTIGPKCHVACLDRATGKLLWTHDLVREYGTTVPQWYAGQCPLVDGDRLILAPAGTNALVAAIDMATGAEIWRSPNPNGWKMTHVSVVPMVLGTTKMYLYCGSGGVAGVSAADGSILWETPEWRISLATVPSPVVLDGGRVFLTGGYGAGSMLIQLKESEGKVAVETVYRLKPEVFGATQHSPAYYQGYLYGIRADGQFTCLDPGSGEVRWTSDPKIKFGLGPFVIADGLVLALTENGELHLMAATPNAFQPMASAKILDGHEAWGPLCIADGRLIARDLTTMVCVDLAAGR